MVRFTLSNRKKTKLFQQAWSRLSEAASLSSFTSSLFTRPVQSHLPLLSLRNTHTHSRIHRCFWECMCMSVWVCFSHMVTSQVCVAVELPSSSSWSSCDSESCGFRSRQVNSAHSQIPPSRSNSNSLNTLLFLYTYLAKLCADSFHYS